MVSHTPMLHGQYGLPWRRSITAARLSSGGNLTGIASYDNHNVAWISSGVPDSDDRLDFVLTAVNSYDADQAKIAALTEALEQLAAQADHCTAGHSVTKTDISAAMRELCVRSDKAYAALALTRGGEA
jgi:hypothetical protein